MFASPHEFSIVVSTTSLFALSSQRARSLAAVISAIYPYLFRVTRNYGKRGRKKLPDGISGNVPRVSSRSQPSFATFVSAARTQLRFINNYRVRRLFPSRLSCTRDRNYPRNRGRSARGLIITVAVAEASAGKSRIGTSRNYYNFPEPQNLLPANAGWPAR